MKFSLAILSAALGSATAQAVTSKIAPSGAAPSGCAVSYDGQFEVTVETVVKAEKRSLAKRGQCGADGILVMTLQDGILKDAKDRTGYIASNYQFQFDGPVQAGALYTAGFSFCGNGSIAIGPTTVFYQCKSGSFWNLYDRWWAEQCEPVQVVALPCGGADSTAQANQIGDGQVVATQLVTTTIVRPLGDGQPQVITTQVPVAMCQIGDGQIQAHTTPCASVTTTPAAVPVSQFTDGQIQVPPSNALVVSQKTDGQVNVPPTTAAPAPAPVASQKTDGQVNVPTTKAAPIKNGTTSAVVVKPSESTLATVPAVTAVQSAPSQVPSAGVGRLEMGSAVAFALGLVGAVAML